MERPIGDYNQQSESQSCELDMRLLHAIREQIQFHLQGKHSH